MKALLAIGADGARGGWLAALGHGESDGRVERIEFRLATTFEQLAALRGDAEDDAVTVCVDIPMGLRETVDLRPCDKEARALLGARANSVFAPPSRPLLAAATHAALAEGRVLRDKKSVGGQAERLQLLLDRFPAVLDALAAFEPGSRAAETADALDALAALDSALHVRAGGYEVLGGETDATGLAMRMVF